MEMSCPLGCIGSLAPCLAGGSTGNHLIHSTFMPPKSASSQRMKVALTTRSRELPAAFKIAEMLARHRAVCSPIVVPTTAPDVGSKGPIPETKTSPFALIAWLYAGGGTVAL